MKRLIAGIFVASLMVCSQAYAIPITYTLSGTATAISSTSAPLSADISGTMVIDSNPVILAEDATTGYVSLNWIVNSFSVTSGVFQFNGTGSMHLSANDAGVLDFNEQYIQGDGSTPYQMGNIYSGSGEANVFFNDDGSLYADTADAYRSGLPYMIAPYWSGGWLFLSEATSQPIAVINGFSAIRQGVAPVPEPGTMILLAAGLFGMVPLIKKRAL